MSPMLSKIDNEAVCPSRPWHADGQPDAPVLDAGAPLVRAASARLRSRPRRAARREAHRVPGHERPRRPPGSRVPAPRRLPVLRPKRRGRPALRLPRLEVRHAGDCIDMPNEPAESEFQEQGQADAYPMQERNGLIWAYMGPRETPPPLPELEANKLPEGEYRVGAIQRESNYLQAWKAISNQPLRIPALRRRGSRVRAARHLPVLRVEGSRAPLPGGRYRLRLHVLRRIAPADAGTATTASHCSCFRSGP